MEPGPPRVLEFGQPRHAVHIKLTGPFWEALLSAQRTGQKVTMNLGRSNEITVGQEKFPFSAHQISRQQDSVSLQDIVQVPLSSGEPCTEVAQVAQRLHIQRVLSEAERERVRLRGLEAETQRRGRTAQVLDKAPKPGRGRVRVNKTVRSMTPPVQRPQPSRGLQQKQPQPQPRSSPLPAARDPTPPLRQSTPPLRQPTPPPSRTGTPPPGSKPKAHQLLSKLGGKAKKPPTSGNGLPQLAAPKLAINAARDNGSLHKVLVACIGNDRPKKSRLDQMLLDVAQRVPGFKHGKDEVVRVLKEVAEYKAPGVYILTDYVRKRELAPMLLASERGSPQGSPLRDPAPGLPPAEEAQAPSKATVAPKSPAAKPAPPQPQPKPQLHAVKRRSATPEADWSALAGDSLTGRSTDAVGEPSVKKQKVVVREAEIVGAPGVDGGKAASAEAAATPDNKKRRKKSMTPKLQSQPAAVAQAKRSAGSPQFREPSQEQNGLPASNGYTLIFGEASSSANIDEHWFEDFVREPRLGRPALASQAEFDRLHEEHDRLFHIYDTLARRIARFKREYEAQVSAAEAADLQEDKARWAAQADRYYNDRCPKVRRQDRALKTLHVELTEFKALLSSFLLAQAAGWPAGQVDERAKAATRQPESVAT